MDSEASSARRAGFLYMVLIIAHVFTIIYVPDRTIVPGDTAASAVRILGSEPIYRAGITVNLVKSGLFLLLAGALYRLLSNVDARLAKLMAVLILIQVPLAIGASMDQEAVLLLLKGSPHLAAFSADHKNVVVMALLRINGQGMIAIEVLWGIWMAPLAVLVYQSGFLPRWWGVYLGMNAFANIAVSVVGIVWPQCLDLTNRCCFPALLAEPLFALWLLVIGAKRASPQAKS